MTTLLRMLAETKLSHCLSAAVPLVLAATLWLANTPASAQTFAGFDDTVVFPDNAGVIDLKNATEGKITLISSSISCKEPRRII